MTFRILIDPKSLCSWGAGRGRFTIYDLQLLSHPTEKALLADVYNNYRGMSGVISNRARQERASWCATVSLSVSVPLRCSACRALPINGVELPSNICHVPRWAAAYRSVAAQTLKTRVCCEERNNFPSLFLPPLFLLDEVNNESF